MLELFKKVWKMGEKQHASLKSALAFSFLRSVFGVTQLIAILLAAGVLTGETEVKNGVLWITVLTFICIIGNFVTSYAEQASTMKAGYYMAADKRVALGGILKNAPLGFFNDHSTGKITATLTTTLSGVESAAAMSMVTVISGLFSAFAMLLAILFYDWRIGILSGLGMVVYLLVVDWQMKVSKRNAPPLQKSQNRLAEAALTFFQGMKVTKAFSFKSGDTQLKEAIVGSSDANITLTSKSMPAQIAAHLTIAVFESLILLATLVSYFAWGDISVVKALVLIIFSFMVYASLNQSGSVLSMIGLLDSSLADVELLEHAPQLKMQLPAETSDGEEIIFDKVSFSYGDNMVLHEVSTVIKPQSLTAVIGPSGSGKTTLCQLIARFRDITDGSIRIGGADIRHLKTEELMGKISMVFQRVYLFEDTILNNLRFGRPNASLEEVRIAARAARCDDFIMALPQGYDTMVDEGGGNLSGGEKQRISIARCILKDSPIVILDEATSALDAENEKEVLSAIDALTQNKTVIMIAHRIKSVQNADHIIALKSGCIVQEGTHEQLIRQKGLYADFIDARVQAQGWTLQN